MKGNNLKLKQNLKTQAQNSSKQLKVLEALAKEASDAKTKILDSHKTFLRTTQWASCNWLVFRTRSLYTVVSIGRRFRPSLNGSAPNSPPANSCPATRRQMKGRGRVKRNLSRSVVSNRCPTSSWSKSSRGPWRVTQSRTRSGHSTSLTMYRYGHRRNIFLYYATFVQW